ncbi:MAG TPA: tetratricopeptide repeat protein [Flavobacteriales bacterium]|nr:tetratricopeptide repeat protein [Flavobacteriales bacterium]
MNKIILFFVLLVFSGTVFSQGKTDSLKKILETCGEDTMKVNTLNLLAWELNASNTKQSLNYAKQAATLGKKLNFITGYTRALTNTGIAYYFMGKYAKALEQYIKAAKLLDGTPYLKRQGALYNNIALIYLDLEKFVEAEAYFMKSLGIDEKLGDKKGMGDSYNNMGTMYKDQKKYYKATELYEKSMQCRKEANDIAGMSSTLTNLGVANMHLKNYDQAIDQLKQALTICIQYNDVMGISLVNNDIGDVYYYQRKYREAIPYYKLSLDSSVKNNLQTYMSYSYQSLALSYAKTNAFQQAYHYHVLYSAIKDSLFNTENSKQLAEMQTKYETEKIEKEAMRSKAESEKEQTMKNIFIGGFAVMVVLAFLILRSYIAKRKSNRIILVQKHEMGLQKDLVEEKNREITDSILYAKRIQNSLLPTEKSIQKALERLNKS